MRLHTALPQLLLFFLSTLDEFLSVAQVTVAPGADYGRRELWCSVRFLTSEKGSVSILLIFSFFFYMWMCGVYTWVGLLKLIVPQQASLAWFSCHRRTHTGFSLLRWHWGQLEDKRTRYIAQISILTVYSSSRADYLCITHMHKNSLFAKFSIHL